MPIWIAACERRIYAISLIWLAAMFFAAALPHATLAADSAPPAPAVDAAISAPPAAPPAAHVPPLQVAIETRRAGWLAPVQGAAGGPGADPIVAVRLLTPARIRYRLFPYSPWNESGAPATPDAASGGVVAFEAQSALALRYRVYSHEGGWSPWSTNNMVAGWPAEGYLLRGLEIEFARPAEHPRDPDRSKFRSPPPRAKP